VDLYNNYQELYNLTQEQKKTIEAGDFDQLLKILEQKRELINEIDKMDLKEYLQTQDNPEKVFNQLRDLMKKIKNLEAENEKELKEKQDRLSKKMKDLNLKQTSRKAYRKRSKYEAKFIDKKR
jgi:uncharacterized protein (DUF3084 family)